MHSSAAQVRQSLSEDPAIRLYVPGRRTRSAARIVLVSGLIVLTVLGSIGPWLPGIVGALSSPSSSSTTDPLQCLPQLSNSTTPQPLDGTNCSAPELGGNIPLQAGAGPLPSLSLPKTILSRADSLVGAGAVVQASADNLTLYDSGARIRLLGGSTPHDLILGRDWTPVGSYSFWGVQVSLGGLWFALQPISTHFDLLRRNCSGTRLQ